MVTDVCSKCYYGLSVSQETSGICPQKRLETMESTEGSEGQCDSISSQEYCMISDGELEQLLFKKIKVEVNEILVIEYGI